MSTQAPPEAAGPGVERGDGAIIYGDETRPHVVIPPSRDREPGLAANVVRDTGAPCARCRGIPDPVLATLRSAIETGPPR
jgi:hypothetical protein